MELKVGMYVRFDYHRVTVPTQISKIILIEYDEDEKYYIYHTENALVITDDNILKASHNLIDLIEVGDYVNGIKVTSLMIKMRDEQGIFGLPDRWNTFVNEIKIKSIVTKEQFESVSYKVGE